MMAFDTLTPDELKVLISQASAKLSEIEQAQIQAKIDLRASIAATVATLDALIGPDNAPPGTDSITAVLGYDGPTMAQHASVTLPLIMQGMSILARATRDLARVVGAGDEAH